MSVVFSKARSNFGHSNELKLAAEDMRGSSGSFRFKTGRWSGRVIAFIVGVDGWLSSQSRPERREEEPGVISLIALIYNPSRIA